MVFCAYCGQNFKRKEHLERHLPTHTNVKPYRCDSCQLSFARKDLLQKHHSTYHEAPDSSRQGDGERARPQRTPIACTKCASSKAACDKKVPCSRCVDKNLPCDARFARRSAKALSMRSNSPSEKLKAQQQSTKDSVKPKDVEGVTEFQMSGQNQFFQNPSNPDLMMWETSQEISSYPIQAMQYPPESIEMPPNCVAMLDGSDGYLREGVVVDPQIMDFEEVQMWNNYSLEAGFDFSNPATMPFLPFTSIPGDGSYTPSIPMTSPSLSTTTSRSQSHSHFNSISSWTGNFEPVVQDQKPPVSWVDSGSIPELDIVIAAEEAWPLARCNPSIFSGACPRTALVHLQNFQDCSKMDDAWNSMNDLLCPTAEHNLAHNQFSIIPLFATTRDKIIAIAQSFLQKALRTHQSGVGAVGTSKLGSGASFFTLPPSNVMENLLGSSVRSLSPYFTLFHGVALDPNELMLDNHTSTLLFLLMMAQGASSIPKPEARNLAAGLTETCRISLFDVIEKNVELSADPVVLKSALLFTILGAWGGDAWHINIAMGQRGMYLAMLKHAGMLEAQTSILSNFDVSIDVEPIWNEWQRREHNYRLVYNWVMIDQELSLFHDIAPILSITEMQTPLPESDPLWRAQNSYEWLNIVKDLCANSGDSDFHSSSHTQNGLSLSHLFQDMLRDELEIKNRRLSPLRLKLLLHPLQSLVCHLGQLLSCFSGMHDNHRSSRPLTTASTLLRLEEVQSSLQKWYDLCMINAKDNPGCEITNSSLVLWHLISLNAITYFPEIENLVRKQGVDESKQDSYLRSQRLIYQPEKAIFHCGQVLKLISAMPKTGRPLWWSAAIYRATMVLLADSISRPRHQRENVEKGPIIMVNLVTPEDLTVISYISNFHGVPCLLKQDNSFTKLGSPDELLAHCLAVLEEGSSTRFSDGIKRKLQKLLTIWNGKVRKASG